MSKNSTQYQHSGSDVVVPGRASAQPTGAEMEEFERFFREQLSAPAVAAGPAGAPVAVNDPMMAELARIVGQDRAAVQSAPQMPAAYDPFAPASANAAMDPLKAFEDELRRFDAAHKTASQPVTAPQQRAEPAFDSLEIEQYSDLPAPNAAPYVDVRHHESADPRRADLEAAIHPSEFQAQHYEPLPGDEVMPQAPEFQPLPEGKPRSKRTLMLLGVAAAVGMAGLIGTIALGSRSKPTGDAPVISAKSGPTKERPADPGGVEVSGQDRQVLARKTEEPKGASSVVTKEEQPVDLNQTPKREVSRVILPPSAGTVPATTQPSGSILMPAGSQPAASANGLEPKRVKSVRISSEAEPVPAPPPAAKAPAAPSLASAPPITSAPPAPPKADLRPATAAKVQPAATTTPQPARPARPVAAAPAAEGGPMSLQPQNSGTQVAKATTPKVSTPTAASGGFAVQMAAPGSEAEARTVINKLKADHGDALGSYSPGVRKADVGGRTVYRVRVGGLSRESANSLCAKLKEDGGSCFVAAN